MSKITRKNCTMEEGQKNFDYSEVSYTLLPKEPFASTWCCGDENMESLGPVRQPEIYETEHHVYSVPFHYENVQLDYWSEVGPKGQEFLADIGGITIIEKQPIVEVICVGSGCSVNGYNIVEWWNDGETLRNCKSQLIKRQRVGGLQGQHPAFIQSALSQELPDFKTLEEAKTFLEKLQRYTYSMTSNYTMPGSLFTGLYENTVHFRIGDTSKPDLTVYKIIVRGGSLDYEDPFGALFPDGDRNRYPADYVFRLIDVIVKKFK